MPIKAYKGFNKDMTCRGFQFEEGKTYEEPEAKLCESGFHACLNPLDCFGYYSPETSEYHEVDLDDVLDERGEDTKICAKKIKIGAKLDVAGICKAHFEFVKSQTEKNKKGKNESSLAAQCRSSLVAQDWSSLAAQCRSSLVAQDWSSLAAQDWSSLAAQDNSSLAARNCSSLAAQDCSSLAARNCSSLAAQDWSSLAAQGRSSLAAQDCSSLAAQGRSSLAAQDWSSLAAQDCSSLAAQDCSSLAAQDWSILAAGENCVIAAFNSKAKARCNTLIALANRNENGVITEWKAGVVDGETLKADTWYKLENGEFVECEDDEE